MRSSRGKPTGGDEGVREVRAAGDSKADGDFTLPVELSSVTDGGLGSGLVISQVVKVLSGAPVGKDVEKAQELTVNPAREIWHTAGRRR
jgi:hypothetical protein